MLILVEKQNKVLMIVTLSVNRAPTPAILYLDLIFPSRGQLWQNVEKLVLVLLADEATMGDYQNWILSIF